MISVCIATYNGAQFIKEQMDSILMQLDDTDQVVVSDDGSTDDTLNIIKSFNDSRITIINNPLDKSDHRHSNNHYRVASNFENALNHIRGEYIFLSDQDDIWYPDKVKEILQHLNDRSIVQTNYSIIDKDSKIIEYKHFLSSPISKYFLKNLIRPYFHGCCMAFSKKLLEYALPFPKNLIAHDFWLGLLAQKIGFQIIYITKPLIKYRRYDGNVSLPKSKNPLLFKLAYRIRLGSQVLYRAFKSNKPF